MTEREALLAAVCADPDDDLPRLVYADWCDDHGEPDRAVLIRLGARRNALLRSLPPDGSEDPQARDERRAIEARMGAIWTAHGDRWRRDELPQIAGIRWTAASTPWWSGFVGSVDADTVTHCMAAIPQLSVVGAITAVGLDDSTGVRRLIETDFFRRIRFFYPSDHHSRGEELAAELLEADFKNQSVHISFTAAVTAATADRLRERFGGRVTLY